MSRYDVDVFIPEKIVTKSPFLRGENQTQVPGVGVTRQAGGFYNKDGLTRRRCLVWE